jgi:hypothetical protein
MSEIKAIETKYNGYHFRSRLEARWAVFFDTLGIKYEYEPEGFDLTEIWKKADPNADRLQAHQVWYLPDFYLPDYEYYLEIKATGTLESQLDSLDRCLLFGKQKPLLMIIGTPGFDYEVFEVSRSNEEYYGPWVFAQDRKCTCLILMREGYGAVCLRPNCDGPKCFQNDSEEHAELEEAYIAARSARF